MVFPSEFEQKLGFDQIRHRLKNYCLSTLGIRMVDEMGFSADFTAIQTLQKQNLEFKLILEKGDEFPSSNYSDPTEYFKTAAVQDSFLEEEAFHNILLSLQTILACRKFLVTNQEPYPELFKLTQSVSVSLELVKVIESKFDDKGQVRDNASAELGKIRKRIRDEQFRVKRLVDQIFRQAVGHGWVPEGSSTTIRDGRLVIPVLAEHKRKLSGFIMDESATGQTVYMEPSEVLEANNEIRDLIHADRREVVKILRELTNLLRINLPELKEAYKFLSIIDFTRAKAKLSLDIRAELPKLKQGPDLNWLQARHPLLYLSLKGKREVVPLTIDLTTVNPFLLVSGPNAGGKSVCLKTVGLIQYMAQCGLLVPLHDNSTVGIYRKIFLDIGDQQSIENDLSTYSSHLKNMAFFLQNSDENTLVLLDELGAGTDPNFGGGIAESVLAGLIDQKVWGVATTHYYNLKLFASNHSSIRNGAMQFDTQKLEPLFQLEIGKPGSSFALEIARKTGLPKATIQRAEQIIGQELTGLESLMKSVAEEKQSLDKRLREIQIREKKLNETLSEYQSLSAELNAKKKEILDRAKTEASNLLKDTNREIEKTIRHIRENKAEKKETKKVREGLQSLVEKVKPIIQIRTHQDKIEIGDSVRLIGQEVSGKVLSMKDDAAVVQFGDLRSQVKVKQLVRSDQVVSNPAFVRAKSLGLDVTRKQSTFVNTLDIRGKRVEEVNSLLDQFIDDAMLLGQSELKILHGKGEGVLRKVVRERLKKIKGVASIADEHVDRGGDGITVVVLK
ncbi:MAG: Smr/MutS family protein [Cyclobacteriaceae bacterium]